MKLRYKIFLFTSNHITGNLVRLKLKSFGNDVLFSDCLESAQDSLKASNVDLLVLNDSNRENPLISLASENSIPLLYVSGGKEVGPGRESISMGLSFTEEEFFHKVSYSVEYRKNDKNVPMIQSVVSHYGGDNDLAQKVVKSFLEVWEDSIEGISYSFKNDSDSDLARKIHSFKGVLSALGETEASSIIRKMEILIKGRNRESAFEVYPSLKKVCVDSAAELEDSALLN